MSQDSHEPLVTLDDVEVHFKAEKRAFRGQNFVKAVDGVSLTVEENEVLALVGESGCGKTTLGKVAVGLQRPTGGSVEFRGQDVWEAKDGTGQVDIAFERIRRSLQIIHQDPESSLNPNRTVLSLLSTPLKKYRPDMGPRQRKNTIHKLLERLGVVPASDYASRFPHQLSGGEQQRIALGRVLLLQPSLVLADEAVSALDVSLRVEMMDIMLDLMDLFSTSFLFISHDFANARYLAKKADGRIGVMYLGKLVEIGPVDEILKNPKHPYTQALVWSTPTLDPHKAEEKAHSEPPIQRIDVPDPENPPSGCNFHTRCPKVIPPEDSDVDQETFRDIMSLRIDIQDRALETDLIWESLGFDSDPALDERQERREEFVAELRNQYFDAAIGEPHQSRIDAALERIADDEWDEAAEELRQHYESVCERVEPELKTDHPVACHLYFGGRPGEPTDEVATQQSRLN